MSLILNGTTGISDVDGTAAAPAIRGTDSNTGIFFPAADTIAFAEGGAEVARFDSSGNLGIGTTTPAYKLDVVGSVNVPSDSSYVLGAGADRFIRYRSGNGDILYSSSSGNFYQQNITSSYHAWFTGNNERARIDSSGNFLSANGTIHFTSAQYRSTVASSQLQFINNANGVSLAVNGTSWGSLSDERDKVIIEQITGAVSKVSSLRSVIGRYKVDDANKRRAFLIAQDVQAVLPEAVTELDDEQKTLILQYTETIPLLVAAIKEQQTLIIALTTRITALEAA